MHVSLKEITTDSRNHSGLVSSGTETVWLLEPPNANFDVDKLRVALAEMKRNGQILASEVMGSSGVYIQIARKGRDENVWSKADKVRDSLTCYAH